MEKDWPARPGPAAKDIVKIVAVGRGRGEKAGWFVAAWRLVELRFSRRKPSCVDQLTCSGSEGSLLLLVFLSLFSSLPSHHSLHLVNHCCLSSSWAQEVYHNHAAIVSSATSRACFLILQEVCYDSVVAGSVSLPMPPYLAKFIEENIYCHHEDIAFSSSYCLCCPAVITSHFVYHIDIAAELRPGSWKGQRFLAGDSAAIYEALCAASAL